MSDHLWARPRPAEPDEWQPRATGFPAWLEAAVAAGPEAAVLPDPAARRASFGYRLGAICIDLGAATAAAVLAALLADGLGVGDRTIAIVAAVAWVATWLAATAGVTALSDGATLGKLVGGMRVVYRDGEEPIGGGTSLLRDSLLGLLYVVPFFWLVDAALAGGAERTSLRDRMAGTIVLRDDLYDRRIGVVSLAATVGVAGTLAAAGLALVDRVDAVRSTTTALPGYTQADRTAFLANCSRQDDPGMCACLFDHVSSHLPYQRYVIGDVWDALRVAYDAC